MNKTMNEMLPHFFSAQSNMQPQAAHSATVSPVFSSIHYKLLFVKKAKTNILINLLFFRRNIHC
jgi:hypothetical protein